MVNRAITMHAKRSRWSQRRHILHCVVAFGLAYSILFSGEAVAFPSFARINDVPCSSCHSSISRRNEFGNVFRLNGYHWPRGDKDSDQREGIDMKGVGILATALPKSIPVGAVVTMSALVNANQSDDPAVALGTPGLTLTLGAELGKHLSVMATTPLGSTPNELLLHVARIGNRPELNLRLGLLEQSTTLFKNNQALLSRTLVNSRSLSGYTVSVGRLGGEVNGIVAKRAFYAVGAVQNAGIGSPVDGYYHLGYKWGGMDLLGNEPDIDLFAEPSLLDHAHLQLGQWGYLGKVTDDTDGTILYNIRRMGLDLRMAFNDLRLQAGTMVGYDRDVQRAANNFSVTWFGEVSYLATSWLTPIYQVQFQDAASLEEPVHVHEMGLIGLLAENLRTRLSFAFSLDGQKNEEGQLQFLLAL